METVPGTTDKRPVTIAATEADGPKVVGQKLQALKDAEAELKTLRESGSATPAQIKAAQEKSLAAQREVVETKKGLNAEAQRANALKRDHLDASRRTAEAKHKLDTVTSGILGEEAPKPLAKPAVSTDTKFREKQNALDARAADLQSTEGKIGTAERKVKAIDARPNVGHQKAQTNFDAAKATHDTHTATLNDLRTKRAQYIEGVKTGAHTPAQAATEVLKTDKLIKEQERLVKKTGRALTSAESTLAGYTRTQNAALASTEAARQSTTMGAHAPEVRASRQALQAAKRETQALSNAVNRNMSVAYQGMNGGMVTHTADQIAAIHTPTPARNVTSSLGTAAAERGAAARNVTSSLGNAVQAVESKGPGMMRRMWNGFRKGAGVAVAGTLEGGAAVVGFGAKHTANAVVNHGGNAIGTVAKTAGGFGRNLMIVGGVGAGLLALTSVLGSNTRSEPRLPEHFGNAGQDDLPQVFNPNADVSVGAVAMPQISQQQQMGSWVSRLPSLDETMAMGSTPTTPSR